jgi:hypothetical protein
MAAEPGGVDEQWGEALDPAEHRDVIDLNTAFDQFLHVTVGD